MEEDPPVVRAPCDHCGCPRAAHRDGRDECESCSCIAFLGPDGLPLPAVPDDPGNLDTREKFLAAGVRAGERLVVTHAMRGISDIRQDYRYAPSDGDLLWLRLRRDSDDALFDIEWDDVIECRRADAPKETGVGRPPNLRTAAAFIAAGIRPGTRLHLHVTDIDGPHTTDDAVFVRLFQACGREIGLIVRLRDMDIDLVWDDVVECWPAPETRKGRKPTNLDTREAFEAAKIEPGTKLHLGVVGNHVTDDAVFVRMLAGRWPNHPNASHFAPPTPGIVVRLGEREHDLPWGDIIECWPVPEPPDPRYADGYPPETRAEDA